MAAQQYLHILDRGVNAWNEWRKEHPEILPDFRHWSFNGTDLRKINLSKANLEDISFFRANLSGANLSGVNLCSTNLEEANLTKVDLSEANLIKTWFPKANLCEANLYFTYCGETTFHRANFSRSKIILSNLGSSFFEKAIFHKAELDIVDFNGSQLDGADFSEASMNAISLGNVDLSQAKGLDTVQHRGPSSIGIDTIYRSQGNIPEVFLRHAGVPDTFITYSRSLIGQPIDYYTCFISYSSKDQAFAERLYADLQNKGVRCWFAPENMKIGDKIRDRIDESIRLYDKLLLVLSEHSVESTWVEKEVETAFEREHQQKTLMLFPIRLDDTVMKTSQAWATDIRCTRHIGDFRSWKNYDDYQKSLNLLLRDLKAEY